MKPDIVNDIVTMHQKFKVNGWVDNRVYNKEWKLLEDFLRFRLNMLEEEFNETFDATYRAKNAEEVVDGLIDMIVIAVGTLDAFGIDIKEAWDEVHRANISKEVGIKPQRPNPLGLPDLIKPEDWKGPNHSINTGFIGIIFEELYKRKKN